MFGVNERPSRSGQPDWCGRNTLVIFLLTALVAGPGFFTYALIGALYRDLPASRLDHHALSAKHTSLPSPVAKSQRPLAATAVSNEETPFMAYRRLRDSAKGIESRSASAQPVRPGNDGRKTFRTVCVRLCDGYYFPIGFNATAAQFAEHEAACQSRCGAPVRLFVYPNPGASPDQMRDLAGNSYLKLENAFRYHVKFNPSCSCRPQPWTLASKQRHQVYARTSQEGVRPAIARTQVVMKTQSAPRFASLEADGVRRDHTAAAFPSDSGTRNPVVVVQGGALTAVLAAKGKRASLLAKVAPTSEQWAEYSKQIVKKHRRVAVAGWSKRKKRPQLSAFEILLRNIEHRY